MRNLVSATLYSSAAVFLSVFATHACANAQTPMERAIAAVERSLPPGWAIAERKKEQIPWGHYWNQDYSGRKGIILIARGVQPVNAEFFDEKNTLHSIHVATEALDIWLMPGEYDDSVWSIFQITRPVQPTVVVDRGPIKIYASPSHLILSEKEFDIILHKFRGIRWPDSRPDQLTWKDWRLKIKKAIEEEFTRKSGSLRQGNRGQARMALD